MIARRTTAWILAAVLALTTSYYGLHELLARGKTSELSEPQPRLFEFTAAPLDFGEKPPTFEVNQGDFVTFMIRSDVNGEIHVHGYEKTIALEPGAVVKLTFPATRVGIHALHLHDPDGRMHGLATLAVR